MYWRVFLDAEVVNARVSDFMLSGEDAPGTVSGQLVFTGDSGVGDHIYTQWNRPMFLNIEAVAADDTAWPALDLQDTEFVCVTTSCPGETGWGADPDYDRLGREYLYIVDFIGHEIE